MADMDELFDQQIHDAYTHIELSAEAEARVLSNLLAAQERKAASEAATESDDQETVPAFRLVEDAATDDGGNGEDRRVVARSRRNWRLVLPIAATIAAVAIVSVIRTTAGTNASMMSENVMATRRDAEDLSKVDADAAPSVNASPGDSLSDMALEDEAAEASGAGEEKGAERYEQDDISSEFWMTEAHPFIELEDGAKFMVLIDGSHAKEVDEGEIGELVGSGKAYEFDPEAYVGCEVYRIKDDQQTYAVAYEGEDTYWYCTKTG